MPTWEEYWGKGGINDKEQAAKSKPPLSSIIDRPTNTAPVYTPTDYSQGNNYGGSSSYSSSPSAVVQQAKPQTSPTGATQLPSWMGNSYRQVPGTDWYSTNPSNPNATKYRADGSPVASVNFDNTKSGGTKFDGYASPEQFQQIIGMQGDPQALSSYLTREHQNGRLTPNDSIYGNKGPSGSLTSLASYTPTWQTGTAVPLYGRNVGRNTPNDGGGTNSWTGSNSFGGSGNGQSIADLINGIYDKNYAAQSQKLKESRDMQLAGLSGQEGVINQSTTAGLNNNDVSANQRMLALKEAMANQGLSSSGDNVSAQIGIGNSQQQASTEINNNKTNQLSSLMAQRGAINNNASASDLALMQQLQGQRDQNTLNNVYKQQQYGLDVAGLTGNLNGQQTMQSTQNDRNYLLGLGGLMGNVNGQQTMQSTQNDRNYQLGLGGLMGNVNGQQTLAGQGQQFNQGISQGQLTGSYDPYASQKQQMAANSAAWFNASPAEQQRLAEQNKSLGALIGAKQDANGDWVTPNSGTRTLAGQQADQTAKYQTGQLNIEQQNADSNDAYRKAEAKWREAEAARQYALANGQIGNARQSNNNYAMQNLMSIWEKTGVAPEGIPGVQAGTPLYNKSVPKTDSFNLDDFKTHINQNFFKSNPSMNNGFSTEKKFDSTGARKYIIGLGMPDSQTDQLLKIYGLPTN